MTDYLALAERLETKALVSNAELAAALREAHAEIERRHGIGGELIIARRERDELRAKVERLRALLRAPPKHSYWGAGEAACPKDIKGSNGELHTLRCRHCGQDSPRSPICLDRIDAELGEKNG